MKARAKLTLPFDEVAIAKAVADSVSLDDQGYIRTRRARSSIVADASADDPLSLLHTLDDYLACISVAERTAGAARPRGRTRRSRV
ncbi:MAG TPA: KEOPS complex subunit Pcc1 [Thermoplasmata archaeon]|jgi:hypothetical protein